MISKPGKKASVNSKSRQLDRFSDQPSLGFSHGTVYNGSIFCLRPPHEQSSIGRNNERKNARHSACTLVTGPVAARCRRNDVREETLAGIGHSRGFAPATVREVHAWLRVRHSMAPCLWHRIAEMDAHADGRQQWQQCAAMHERETHPSHSSASHTSRRKRWRSTA
jgi:hypothetical protein